MNNEQILEGNKLILDFLYPELEQEIKNEGITVGDNMYAKCALIMGDFDRLSYHTSWNWLMEVVEKIESITDEHHGKFKVYILGNICIIQGSDVWKNFLPDVKTKLITPIYSSNINADSKIESTWLAVVQFIKWYNNY